MESGKIESESSSVSDEDTIYKSLTHPLRRQIIKAFAGGKTLTFSEIKKRVDPIDSPALSYHLKSLQALISSREGKYLLSGVGDAALNLLLKVDEGDRVKKSKRHFLYAYWVTALCWITAQTLVPLAYWAPYGVASFTIIEIVLNAVPVVNYIVIWALRRRY
jgi:hypothetical protein